jgi:hypothetical protein
MIRITALEASYKILRGCWCDFIILNVHAPKENKTDGYKILFL